MKSFKIYYLVETFDRNNLKPGDYIIPKRKGVFLNDKDLYQYRYASHRPLFTNSKVMRYYVNNADGQPHPRNFIDESEVDWAMTAAYNDAPPKHKDKIIDVANI